jgi:hypothetical protein
LFILNAFESVDFCFDRVLQVNIDGLPAPVATGGANDTSTKFASLEFNW